MRQMIDKILHCYGSPIVLHHGDHQVNLRAFLQPLLKNTDNKHQYEMTPLGSKRVGQYVYYGPAEPVFADEDWLEADGIRYEILRSERIRDWDGPVYCRAVCAVKGGDDAWSRT